ncbi:MAG: Uma2 family endonuclease [Candidatus Cybelea sp.]
MIAIREPEAVDDRKLLVLSQLNPGYRFERGATGKLIVSPTGGESARREAALTAQLVLWSTKAGRGPVFSPSAGFRLPDGSVLSPESAWIAGERWDALSPIDREGFVPLAPNVVFEIRSQTDSLNDVRAKMRAYINNGVQVAVLIDPYERFVELFRPQQEQPERTSARRMAIAPEMPGFEIETAQLLE